MEHPSYPELLKIVWFLVWRQIVILAFVFLMIGWGSSVILNSPMISSTVRSAMELVAYGVWFFGVLPFIIKTIFQKQFQGFHITFHRDGKAGQPQGQA
jgi:hypothetical protein